MPKVKGSQIKDESITGTQIENDTITGDDIDESTLVMTLNDVLSDGASTTLTINSGSIIPSTDTTYDLGSMDKVWSNIYSTNIFVQNLDINQAFSFPTTDGSNGQVLKTNGSGTLTWQNESGGGGSPSGNNEEIQFNNNGSFGASSNLTFGNNEFVLAGNLRQCDPNFSSTEEKIRSFTYKKHIQFSGISANTWHDVISFRPYLVGTTTDPTANSFYSTVAFKMEIFGNTGNVGSGYRSRMGSVQFNGSSSASANATDTTLDNPISTRVNRVGWVTTLQINPDQAGATNFTGVVYLEIYFGRGQGSNGNNIEWNIT